MSAADQGATESADTVAVRRPTPSLGAPLVGAAQAAGTFSSPPPADEAPAPIVLHDPYASRRTAAGVPPPRLERAAADALVRRFAERYERGDMPGLRALFTADPDRRLRRELRRVERTVEHSDYRRIRIHGAGWQLQEDSAILAGTYVATVIAPGAAQGTVSHGTIRLDLVLEGGEPRIRRLQQEPAGD